MWFRKKGTKEILIHKELEERALKLAKEIDSLSQGELTDFIIKGKVVPDEVKIKLYDFLVEFNTLDSIVDQIYKKSLGVERNVSSNGKGLNTTLNELFKSKDKKLESFLIDLNVFDSAEISKKLIIIGDAIKLRDRIAHAIPIWHGEGKAILFNSYDGIFWNRLYNSLRQNKSELYQDVYFKKLLDAKILPQNSFSYVIYHIFQVNFLTEKIRDLRLKLINEIELDKEISSD